MEHDDPSPEAYQALAREFDRLCERQAWAERTMAVLISVDDAAWKEQPARALRKLIHLSFGQGRIMVHVRTQRELAERIGMAETHLGRAIEELIEGNALQFYPESKLYEVLPDVDEWRTAARCARGFKGGRELEAKLFDDDRRHREQTELGEIHPSFHADTSIKQAAGQNARQEAGFPREEILSAWTETTATPAPSQTQPSVFPPRADARGARQKTIRRQTPVQSRPANH